RSGVGEARRTAARLAELLGFSESAAGTLALVVTEAATNIVKHAGHGELIFRALQSGSVGGIELLALDRGPGLANPSLAMRDGHSTAGSPGTGLGAMRRMASEFDFHTTPGKGTALRLVVWAAAPPRTNGLAVGAVCLPKSGETACGDAWAIVPGGREAVLCVADGLGHGPDAATAARAAIAAVSETAARESNPSHMIEAVHLSLRPTRGAAVAVARLSAENQMCNFCGVGNISGCLISRSASRSMVSHGGILGHQVRKIHELSYPFPDGALCILHSDGLATRWRLQDYPGLERTHPGLIAGVLYRDYSRRRDDTAVIVVRRSRDT
ncbi:MAG TPA: ATP-binding SpoIIE family protein phosphatase, partial [Burkholderiales bacterium]|nr:ATP-binding SpoIIE family protein phosphatase [Burkholderiales bacterium]